MSHDYDRRNHQPSQMPTTRSDTAAPGQMSRSAELRKPAHPVPSALSGLSQARNRDQASDITREAEPTWIASARACNAAHADLVAEFNESTHHECIDDARQLSPQKVAAWQSVRSLLADGKVGPQTVSSARGMNRMNRSNAAAPLEGAPAAHAMFEKARQFNAAHPALVAEFNELTAYFCFDFERNELVPEAVAKWQIRHGEPADGMVMPDTIAAAKSKRTAGATS